jgi:hypothetical protein
MIEKNRKPLIITVMIIVIAIVFVYFSISGIFVQTGKTPVEQPLANSTPALPKINSSFKNFPPEIQGEIQTISDTYSIPPPYWGFDPVNNEIDLIAHDINSTSAIKELPGKQIGNYRIHAFNDTELASTQSEVSAHLWELMKNRDYQISNIALVTSGSVINPTGPYVELWAYKSAPENEKLDKTMIKGWRILVFPLSYPLPTTQYLTMNTANTSS